MCSVKAFPAEVQAVREAGRGEAPSRHHSNPAAEGKADELVLQCLLALYFLEPEPVFPPFLKASFTKDSISMLPLISFCFPCHEEKCLTTFGLHHQRDII